MTQFLVLGWMWNNCLHDHTWLLRPQNTLVLLVEFTPNPKPSVITRTSSVWLPSWVVGCVAEELDGWETWQPWCDVECGSQKPKLGFGQICCGSHGLSQLYNMGQVSHWKWGNGTTACTLALLIKLMFKLESFLWGTVRGPSICFRWTKCRKCCRTLWVNTMETNVGVANYLDFNQ